jgi:hypothetical protein
LYLQKSEQRIKHVANPVTVPDDLSEMIFRLSQKLNAKIKAGTLGALLLDENPLADWTARVFIVDRTQYGRIENNLPWLLRR